MAGRQTQRLEHLVALRALDGDDAVVAVQVRDGDALRRGGLQPSDDLGGVGRVGDEEDVVVGLEVDDEVVDDAPRVVAAQGVLRRAGLDAAHVVGQARVDEVGRARAGHRGLAEVAHVEDADALAHCGVLGDDAAARVLDRHVPATEVGHLGAEGDVAVVQG